MDYTRTPGQNKSPGPENFLFLKEIYGVANRRRSFLRKLVDSSPAPVAVAKEEEALEVSEELRNEMLEAVDQIEQRFDGQEHLDGWFEEHRNEFGSMHSRYFGEGRIVRVSKLLVPPDEL